MARRETAETQRAGMLRARGLFEEAAKQLQAAKTQIDKQFQVTAAPATPTAQEQKEILSDVQLQAELEQGINLVEQAQTYTEQSEFPQRAALSRRPATNSSMGWPGASRRRPTRGKRSPGSAVATSRTMTPRRGVKLTWMSSTPKRATRRKQAGAWLAPSGMQALAAETDQKKALAEIVNAGEEWLRLYPNYLNTPEGQRVRFALANAYLKQARALPKASSQARDKYESARKQFQILEQTANDYTAVAHDNRLNIVLLTSLERTKGEISKLRDFEECYLRAELESAKIAQVAKELRGEKLEKERKLHFRNMVEALTRGLDLADVRSSAEDVHQARLLRAYAYLALGDYYRAAVAGEDSCAPNRRPPRHPWAELTPSVLTHS